MELGNPPILALTLMRHKGCTVLRIRFLLHQCGALKSQDFFYNFCGSRATLCGNWRNRCPKTEDFLRFLRFARDPLRALAWSRCKNLRTFYDFCGSRAALCGVGVVEVQKLRTFYDLSFARATLSAQIARVPRESVLVSANLLRRSCVLKRSLWCREIFFSRTGLCKLSRGLRACFRNPAVVLGELVMET